MLPLETMLFRLFVAAVLGALVGLERELVNKDAGIRTNMLVSAGSAIFSMVGIVIHSIIAQSVEGADYTEQIIQSARGIAIIAGVVSGIGFLGAGVIIKEGMRARGLTTAAAVWFVAAIGVLAGIGMISFAVSSTLIILFMMVALRKFDPYWIAPSKDLKNKYPGEENQQEE